MAGIWVRSGTIALTSGSKKVTGTGTAWNSGLNKVTKGCALKHNNIDYEVDYVNSDTEFYLVDAYNGAAVSGQAYRIQVAVTDTIPELSSRIAQALAYWNGQGANLQLMMSGSGNVTLTFPDGTQVTVPAWGNMQPKDALLTAIANLTTSADKLFYATGADAVAMTTLSAKGRELIDDADSSAMLTTLGVSTFIKSLLDDADAATALGTLGITKASITETNSRLAADRVVTPAGLNAVVPYAPTINPTLDLDFAKQKYRWYAGAAGLMESSTPSLMTFTRSSIAKYFDAMGVLRDAAVDTPRIDYDPLTGECKGLLIEESRTNLLTYSSTFRATSGWGTSGAPYLEFNCNLATIFGYLNGTRLTTTTLYTGIYKASTVTNGTTYTLTLIFTRLATTGKLRLAMEGTAISAMSAVIFNLSDLSVSSKSASSVVSTRQINANTFSVSITDTTTAAGILNSVIYGGESETTMDVLLQSAQLEAGAFPTSCINSVDAWTARASTATYYDSNGVLQTAASGVARSAAYDYDSNGVLRPIGLLLENAETNLLLYSEQLDNAAWAKSNITVTANAAVATDGNTTADKLVESSATGSHNIYQLQTASASKAHIFSAHIKAGERSNVMLQCFDGASYVNAYFDVSAGVVVSQSGVVAKIRKSSYGFYRCSIAFTTGAAATSVYSYIYLSTGSGVSNYTGDGTSGIYVWGAQLAAGNYATSYIATTSSQVTRAADTSTSAQATRAADNAVISGANFSQWYKQYEGTLISEAHINDTGSLKDFSGSSRGVASINSGSSSNTIRFGAEMLKSNILVNNGVTQATVTVGSSTLGRHKIAMAFKLNSLNAIADSVAGVEDASLTVPYTTQLNIGKSSDSNGFYSGHIRTLKYFPKALSAAELQAMTA